jgi:ribosome-binding factor A
MSNRPERVGEAIRDELSTLLGRDVHDPGIGFLTLTKVKVTSDLQLARVYYTTMGDEAARRETVRALKRASPFLRRQIAQRIRLRRAPELEFFYDDSIARHDRIEQILQELKTERGAEPGAASRETGLGDVSPEPASARGRAKADEANPPGSIDQTERASRGEGTIVTEPHERSGALGPPASERVGGAGGPKPPGSMNDDTNGDA